MVDFFYSLPVWAATLLILATSLAVGLASSLGLRRVLRLQSTEDDREHAVSLMQVVAAYIGILIAFAGVQVWQDFSDAQGDVHREAATAAELYRDLNTYGPETQEQKQALRAYVVSVVRDEWPLLAKGEPSPRTEVALFRLFHDMGKMRPKDDRDSTIFAEAFSNLNDLVGLRRDRLIHSRSGMPLILWIVGLVGSVLIVSYAATFKPSRTNVMMISGISLALGLVFLFILIVDRPYKGAFSVDNSELAGLPAKFELLDRLAAQEEGLDAPGSPAIPARARGGPNPQPEPPQ
jgi:hypothetical protein